MKRFLSLRYIELAILILIGLIPLLWFRGNEVILGHDSGLTINPYIHFFDRLSLWTQRYGFGVDQTYALPGFFIHGLEALISSIGVNLQTNQKIIFVFWFILPGLSMFYLASKLEKRFKIRFFALPVAVFYMMNHYLLQGWFIAERTKFSTYAAFPLLIAFLFDWHDKKISSLQTGIRIALLFFFFNGLASLPLFGGIIVFLIVYVIYFFIIRFSWENIIKLLKLTGITIVCSFMLHAYWLLSYIYYVKNFYAQAVSEAGGIGGVLGWIDYISKDTSLINMLRLQGIPEWYQNPYHSYANNFLTNPALILISFLIPFTAFSALLMMKLPKHKTYIVFFALLALFSMLFVGGSHPPFGFFYILLVRFIPGFLAFRTPFYKFAPALWLSYSILIGFTISRVLQDNFLKKHLIFSFLVVLAVVSTILIYNYPFLDGSFFNYIVGQRSMKVQVPKYIYDFGKWSERPERFNVRTLALPPTSGNVEVYDWGYWSLAPVTSLLTNSAILNENGMTIKQREIIEDLFYKMKHGEDDWIKLAKMLGINSFLVRNDFVWNLPSSPTDNPAIYEKILKSTPDVYLYKKFGKWSVYNIRENFQSSFITRSLQYLEGDEQDLATISTLPQFNPNVLTYVSGTQTANNNLMLEKANSFYITPDCLLCTLKFPIMDEGQFVPTLTPDSFLYSLVQMKESRIEQQLVASPVEKADYFITRSIKDQKGAERVIDEKKPKEAIELSIQKYLETFIKLRSSLENIIANNALQNNAILMKAFNYLEVEHRNVIDKFPLVSGDIDVNFMNKVYKELDNTLSFVKENTWYTSDISQKKYIFTVPEDGDYTMYIKSQSLSQKENNQNRTFSYVIDGNNFTVSALEESKTWLMANKVKLGKGLHTLLFNDSPQVNVYANKQEVLTLRHNPDRTQSCAASSVIPSENTETYDISFEYRQVQGNAQFFFYPLQKGNQLPSLSKQGQDLKNVANWERLRTDYMPNNNNGFFFYICTRLLTDKQKLDSILEVRNITIHKLTIPQIVFVKEKADTNKSVNNAVVRNISNTEYLTQSTQDLRDTFIFTNTSYSPNWHINSKDAKHFIANGYGNAWFIHSPANTLAITYNPQRFVIWGFVISVVSLIIVLLLIIILEWSGRKHYEKKH